MEYNVVMTLLKVSLSTSVILALLLLFAPLLGKRYPAKWRCLAWLAISIRLLIPIAFTFHDAPVQIGVPEPMLTSGYSQPTGETTKQAAPFESLPLELSPDGAWSQFEQVEEALPAELQSEVKMPSPVRLAFWIWLIGVAVFFSIQAVVYIRFIRRLHYSPRSEIPAFIRDKLLATGKELGLTHLPVISVCQCVPSPILIGLLKPKLLLPHGRYSPQEISFILRHELVHFRRGDLWYKLVLTAANGLHWFNPLVYLMVARAGKDAELSCDDEVTAGFCDDERSAYGNTILAALPRKGRIEPVFTTSFGSTKSSVKQRLQNLFDRRTKRNGILALCSVILCIGITCGFFAYVPVSAATTEKDKMEYSIENKFSRYRDYGLIYDEAAETLTYNGERVKFFFDFLNETQRTFDIFWSDGKTSSTLCFQGVRDSAGKITGIKTPDNKTLREVLEGYNGGLGGIGGLSDKPKSGNSPPAVYTMDATYRNPVYRIVATDKISKTGVPESVKVWLEQCDKKPGTYIFTQTNNEGFDTYVYYNAGGRYPWNMEVDKNAVRLDLYENNNMVTGDGYYLMHFTSPKNYENIQVYLDGKTLETGVAATSASNRNMPLVNTKFYPLSGVESIDISYLGDNITILEGEKDRIELREYMSANNKSYYAQVTLDTSKIVIGSGDWPKPDSLQSGFPSKLEVYLPKSYHGALSIETVSATIHSDVAYSLSALNAFSTTGKVEFYDISAGNSITAGSTSGKVIFHDISADSIKLTNTAGPVTVHRAEGNIDIKSTSGDINIGVPESMQFRFQASSTGSMIKTFFEQTIKTEDRDRITIVATVGQTPDLTVSISTTAGDIRVDKR